MKNTALRKNFSCAAVLALLLFADLLHPVFHHGGGVVQTQSCRLGHAAAALAAADETEPPDRPCPVCAAALFQYRDGDDAILPPAYRAETTAALPAAPIAVKICRDRLPRAPPVCFS